MSHRRPVQPIYYSLTELAKLTGMNRRGLLHKCQVGLLAYTVDADSRKPSFLVPRAAVERLIAGLEANTRGGNHVSERVRPPMPNTRLRRVG